MSDIPKAREEVTEVADILRDIRPDLAAWLVNIRDDLMWKAAPLRIGRVKNDPMTPELRDRIKAYFATHPDAHIDEIARAMKVNMARVSDALHGHYDNDEALLRALRRSRRRRT